MENEYYYRNQLQMLMEDFIEKETADGQHEWGYIPAELEKLMADAAFNVLLAVKSVNDFRDSEQT